ncbi:protein of unknown function [Candidatus Nitrosocosmicus franklandus]|uniref:Uncharacterized protein n=1 Tax=Candidatus Nitrosocosmicus franklandianus TaxID=1798806 RepID=A0A484I697_9ARCH|nr:protein of unknown function [Candidatus Nitrosocosmicus franklandus]
MVSDSVATDNNDKSKKVSEQYCCKEFLKSSRRGKIYKHNSSFTEDKYYCVLDGFGFSVLENILFCPYCGSRLIGC